MEVPLYIGPLGSLEVSLELSVLYYFFFFFGKIEQSQLHVPVISFFSLSLPLFLPSSLFFSFSTNLAHFGIIPVMTENKEIIKTPVFIRFCFR